MSEVMIFNNKTRLLFIIVHTHIMTQVIFVGCIVIDVTTRYRDVTSRYVTTRTRRRFIYPTNNHQLPCLSESGGTVFFRKCAFCTVSVRFYGWFVVVGSLRCGFKCGLRFCSKCGCGFLALFSPIFLTSPWALVACRVFCVCDGEMNVVNEGWRLDQQTLVCWC